MHGLLFNWKDFNFTQVNYIPRQWCIPVHSLLLVKSIPRMRLDDSKPASLKAAVTWKQKIPFPKLQKLGKFNKKDYKYLYKKQQNYVMSYGMGNICIIL